MYTIHSVLGMLGLLLAWQGKLKWASRSPYHTDPGKWAARFSGHHYGCTSYSQEDTKGATEKNSRMTDVSNLINICRKNPIQVSNLHGFFYISIKKNRCWYLGPTEKTESILGIRQTYAIPKQTVLVPHSQPTASQPAVWKLRVDLLDNIFH